MRALLDVSNWGLWLASPFEAVTFVLMLVYTGWFILWILWDAYWRPWKCRGCGRKNRGKIGKDGWRYESGDQCEVCAWTPVSHAQYNQMFGISNRPRRVK